MLKHTTILASAALAFTLGTVVHAQDETAETVVATIDGVEVTLGEMIIARAQLPQEYQQLPDDVLFEGILDQLIQQQLLAATLETDPLRVRLALENERRALLAGEVVNTMRGQDVSEEELQAAYDEAFGAVDPETEFNASHILVETEEEAVALKSELDGGAEFADLARENSNDSSAANGGSLGWFGLGMMVEPFEAAVLTLEPGDVSDPIETQFGWHVIVLNETRLQEKPALDDVRAELSGQIQQQALEARLTELNDAAEISRPDEGTFDPTVLRNLDLLQD